MRLSSSTILGPSSSMSRPQITFVYGDDWEGLYVNGRLEAQGHAVSRREILSALGYSFEEVEADLEWLHDEGELPPRLSDVQTIS